jgi:hypothetical protein
MWSSSGRSFRAFGVRLIAEHSHETAGPRGHRAERLAMGTWVAFVIGVSGVLLRRMFVFQF